MVTKKNLLDIVRKLVSHLELAGFKEIASPFIFRLSALDGQTYRDEVVSKIIYICSQDKYKVNMIDISSTWLIALLVHHQLRVVHFCSCSVDSRRGHSPR